METSEVGFSGGSSSLTSLVEQVREEAPLAPLSEIVEVLTFELSDEQKRAKELILEWLKGPSQEFRLGGYAGTGKTTLIKELLNDIRNIAVGVGAFTGKAVSVLRRKGIGRAVTLHSMLYHAEYDSFSKKMVWIPRTFLPYDMVIVDEASMVSLQLYEDLKRHGCKLLFVGDPAQLEPVGDNPNLMRECYYTLTEIHRQAKKSPILRLARAVREGMTELPEGEWGNEEDGHLVVTGSMYGIDLAKFDVVVCAKNATRHSINERRRIQLERFGAPVIGDQVICLSNNRQRGVYNGMMLNIDKVFSDALVSNLPFFNANLSDEVDEYTDIPVLFEFFGKDYKRSYERMKGIPFDYGYCLTAHKSQGSEWDKVLVLDEPLYKTDRNRWRYTAITRAAKELTVVLTE